MTSNTARRQQAAAVRSGSPASPGATDDSMWQLRGHDGSIATGWYLLPLRLFLGVTFLFAGLQKLSDPNFFRASAPGSIHAQMVGAARTSPLGSLVGHLVGASSTLGVLIAVGEIAVGVGALLGLLTRIAAIGGALLAFSLFLVVSFRTSPYYTGADIVFLFAWTPFVLAGAAGAPALDTWLDRRPEPVPGEPFPGSVSRGAFIGMVAAGTAVLVAAVAGIGRALAPSASSPTSTLPPATSTTTSTTGGSTATTAPVTSTTAAPPKGTAIGPASSVPVGGSASFTDPSTGDPSLVIQHTADKFVAFDAICPHAGCTVAYQSGSNIIACPCHGSEFDPKTGAVVLGPATSGLTPIKVIKGSNGNLYVV